ncbi:enoyl-CoA hydratase/isomerase family protein, partial [Pseudomonadales bacterium]|nr:enoyl-CoA hydratase/isomerase family protein [Pseudomonadales bacterium]
MAVVKTETKEFVHVITMDRAEALNAFNNDMMDELCEAFLAATIDDQVRVVVLTGAGRAFSAGA